MGSQEIPTFYISPYLLLTVAGFAMGTFPLIAAWKLMENLPAWKRVAVLGAIVGFIVYWVLQAAHPNWKFHSIKS